jgi:hypothetical protein
VASATCVAVIVVPKSTRSTVGLERAAVNVNPATPRTETVTIDETSLTGPMNYLREWCWTH